VSQSCPERLLLDALVGDPTLLLRSDEIEASWRYADEIRNAWQTTGQPPLLEYPAGTRGPSEADELFYGCEGGWLRG
jgi:glucose-6-phosphate 1-dehydrogenase